MFRYRWLIALFVVVTLGYVALSFAMWAAGFVGALFFYL